MDDVPQPEDVAYAKINLALHVRGREPDGYHRIETLFAFAEHGDRLHVEPAEGLSLAIEGPFAAALAAGDDNLVLRAARALAGHCDIAPNAALTLDKRLPVAAGIGGGSADAAAALRLLNRWWRLQLDESVLRTIAGRLGADVPACIGSRAAIGTGRGDQLAPADGLDLAGAPILLVNPGASLSTASVFAGWDGIDRGPVLDDWRAGRNDLEAPARALVPEIGMVLENLQAGEEVVAARMSGSGATCFALYETEAARDAAAARIRDARPAWWRLASRIR